MPPIDLILFAIFAVSTTYLAWRAGRQWRTQRLSYARLPFPVSPLVVPLDADLNRACGALLGVALGDALGAPRESLPVVLTQLRYGREPVLSRGVVRFMRRRGTVTDDTQLTFLVAKAIGEGGFDAEVFRASLVDWWDWRVGAGRATDRAVRGEPDGDSQGNGAAMRVAPLVLLHFGRARQAGTCLAAGDEAMLADVAASARVTHPNAEAVAGAEAVARATAHLLGTSADAANLAEVAFPAKYTKQPELWRSRLHDAARATTGAGLLGGPGWVPSTVSQAVYLFTRFGVAWRPALRELFAAGGDTDTVAAIYLSWVGARWGTAVLEPERLGGVQGAGVLVAAAERLMGVEAASPAGA